MTHAITFARLVAATILTACMMLAALPTHAETKGSSTAERSDIQTIFTSGKAAELKKKHEERLEAFKQKIAERRAAMEAEKAKADSKKAEPKKKQVSANPGVMKKKPAKKASGPAGISKLIAKYAALHGVPYKLAKAVVQVESSFRPHVTGAAGEIGLMQIKLSTARGMGYKGGAKELYEPAKNLYWDMKYLGKAHQLSGGSTCGTILKYNAGHYAKRNNPISTRYCEKVRKIMA